MVRGERLELLANHLATYDEESADFGEFWTVDYQVPPDLHDFFDLAPPMRSQVPDEWLSQEQVVRREHYGSTPSSKLVPFLGPQVGVTHTTSYLQTLVRLGVRVTRVHRECWRFRQGRWMEDFVNDLSGRRREATDELLRDIYKMTQNSVYGKTLQNSRGI